MSEIHDENEEPMRPVDEEPAADDEPAGEDEPPQAGPGTGEE
jgi:hypothetical protein